MSLVLPIQSNGFILREFQQSDAMALSEIEFDPDVKRYLALPDKPKNEWIKGVQHNGIDGWVIQVEDSLLIAGCASLLRAKRKGDGELRIVIGNTFRKGLGTDVAKLLIKIGFEQLSAKAIVGIVHPENTKSLRIVRRLRFRRRGKVQEPAPQWQIGHYIYRLTEGVYNEYIKA
jgi:RimJ/RimL family protein N-acetyltransferase